MSLVPQVLKSLKTLPPFPLVAQRSLLLLNQSEVNIQELVDIVKFDPAITANVLRINKNLRNRRATTTLNHLFAFYRVTIDRQFLERYAFAVQQRFRTVTERAGRFGVDLDIGLN